MTIKPWDVWIGFDPREADAFAVARSSLRRFHQHAPISGVRLADLRARGLYTRETEKRLGRLWDNISGAYMSTEFAISRFLVPELKKKMSKSTPYGWSLFTDCDVLFRGSLSPMFKSLDDSKAVYCVKHKHYKPSHDIKMDGQLQTIYARKNWSSVMAINVDHPANKALSVEMVNALPGRDLHRFCWLDDDQIGELGPEFNYLVGESKFKGEPKIVHFTNGYPGLSSSFNSVEYAPEWFAEQERWAA